MRRKEFKKEKSISLLRGRARVCCVTGCNSGDYQLSKWKDDVCLVHQEFHSKCSCNPPFLLFTFPTEKADPIRRKKWIKMINRLGKDNKPWMPGKKVRVCSKHFVDSEPSKLNPLPTLNLGYESKKLQEEMEIEMKKEQSGMVTMVSFDTLQSKNAIKEKEKNLLEDETSFGNDDDILDEEFLAKAFGGSFQANRDHESEDCIDDIDIDFEEGDGDALIHQESKPIDSEKAAQGNVLIGYQTFPEKASEDVVSSDDENLGLKDIKIEVIHPANLKSSSTVCSNINDDNATCSSNSSSNYKAFSVGETKNKLGSCSRGHGEMCQCENCQLLMDTYNEFMQKRLEKEKQVNASAPLSVKIPRLEVNQQNAIQRNTATVERTKFCQKCDISFDSHNEYREHVKEKHPIYWKHVALESDFQEKRKLVVRSNNSFDKSQSSSNRIFFRRELERTNQPLTMHRTATSSQSTVLNQQTVPNQPATHNQTTTPNQTTMEQPSTSTKNENSPVTYFYPMLYPVYFVMDKNQQTQPGTFSMMAGHQPGIPIPQMPQIGSMAPPGPVMVPPQMMMSGLESGNMAGQIEKVVCGECGLMFKFKEELMLHMRVHSKLSKPHKCETCDISFINNVDLKRHYRTHASFSCSGCNEIFTTREKLLEHENTRHNENLGKVLTCRTCQMSFSNNVELKRHYRTHAFFKCKICGETFVSWEQLVQHNNSKHVTKVVNTSLNDVKYLCNFCDCTFLTYSTLQEHDCHNRESPDLQCKKCGDEFENHHLLQEHQQIKHSSETGDHSCTVCDKNFENQEEMDNHMKEHESKGDIFTCYYCNLSFVSDNSLAKHLKLHTIKLEDQENPELIQEQNIKKEPIDYHLVDAELEEDNASPTKNKHYSCNKCGSLFSRMFSLNRHYKIHTGERGYKCSECGASFRTQSQQKTHMLTHTGERPFKCHICPATFIQQGNLKRHIWTHTGTKPHVCSICQAGFLSTSDLKRHFRTHTGEKPYKCQLCHCSFTTSGNLKSHLKTHSEKQISI